MQTGRSKHITSEVFVCVINSKLQSLRQHTDRIYNASLLVPGVSKMLSLLACKMSCFSFTSCFPSLSSVSNQMYFHSSFLSGNLYFPHFTPPLALDLSSVWVCLRQTVCSCLFPLCHKKTLFCDMIRVLYSWVTVCCLWPTKHLPALGMHNIYLTDK